MAKDNRKIDVADFTQDALRTIRRVRRSNRPLMVTEQGKATAVLLSVNAYERDKKEREILELLARGEKQIVEGGGYDLDDVLAEADELLKKL